jgi:hypothetical protein
MVALNVITIVIIAIIIIIITLFWKFIVTFADTQISKLGLSTLISERRGPSCSLFYNVIDFYL